MANLGQYSTILFLNQIAAGEKISEEVWNLIWPQLYMHRLVGFVAERYSDVIPVDLAGKFIKIARQQAALNMLLLNECRSIERELTETHNIVAVRLKGAALIESLYLNYGERHLTDIDLLVTKEQYEKAKQFLFARNYSHYPQIRWEANNFKDSFFKRHESGAVLYIDLHSQLFWKQNLDIPVQTISDSFTQLSVEYQLLHLVANWAYQDTFLSLSKLIDIDLYIQKWPHLMSSQEFLSLISKYQLESSWYWVQQAILFIRGGRRDRKNAFFDVHFLENPKANLIKYLTMKHLTKDSLFQAFEYDFKWGVANIVYSVLGK